ncbi:hypothetical protein GCM10029992_17210 [Glycomyces albus]
MRLRLSDIAQQAGVSEATVSRVLNDKPGVGAQTRQSVLTALDVLGYERPPSLRKHAMGLIGLVVPELENPIFPLYAQTVSNVLAGSGYTPVLCTQTPGGVSEDEYVDMLRERAVAGIIFVSGLHADTTASTDRYRELQDKGSRSRSSPATPRASKPPPSPATTPPPPAPPSSTSPGSATGGSAWSPAPTATGPSSARSAATAPPCSTWAPN